MREVETEATIKLVHAEDIEEGECFRKRTGTYVYVRVSESAVRYYIENEDKDTPQDSIYGVCLLNGNMTKVSKNKIVVTEQIGWGRVVPEGEEEE